MRANCCLSFMLAMACVFSSVMAVCGDDDENPTRPAKELVVQPARTAAERGLAFLEKDVVKWRDEHECSTCHHGTMTLWAYSEAKSRGYSIDADVMKETVDWAKQRFMERIDLPRDTRPGWSMVSTPAIYLALMAQCVENQTAVSADELRRIEQHLLRHQESDGSWAWSSAPPINRPPPFFESDEVATRLAIMALGRQTPPNPNVSANPPEDPAIRDSRAKAAAWLAMTEPVDTTQAAALRLLMKVRAGESAEMVESEVAQLLKRRNADGGWGQLNDLPSDAYATGQSLYVLSLAGVKAEREEIRRAVALLVASQNEDGSWPMKSRAHPGATPYKNPVPITYFGSAWATLGLMRSIPAESQQAGTP
ncbi:MAG: terpene cyclase/mutase family protein [Planctomycetota bacterium]|nr:terpene cyclase/mutase family protein [Planctomycetota bacterium]